MTDDVIEPGYDPGAEEVWRDSVRSAVRQAGGDQAAALLDSVEFLGRLDGLVGVDPADPRLAAGVAQAVQSHLAATDPVDYRTCSPEEYQAGLRRYGVRLRTH